MEGLLNTQVTEGGSFEREYMARMIRSMVRRFAMGRSAVRTAEKRGSKMEWGVSVTAMGMVTMRMVRPPTRRMGEIPVCMVSTWVLPPRRMKERVVVVRLIPIMTPAVFPDGPQWK